MPQELQIKALLLDLQTKLDKNHSPYFRISLQGLINRYFYAFSNSLPENTFKSLTDTPHNFINRQVLITYQEIRSIRNTSVVGDQLTNQDTKGTFFRVQQIEII